jgi:GNAT superfamily N-acetyltransferase
MNSAMHTSVLIREMAPQDIDGVVAAFAAQGWDKPQAQYQRYLDESRQGLRTVLLAEYEEHFGGYLTIVWNSSYPPFRAAGIPEIVDFNVLIKFRRRGIGTALMNEAERLIRNRSTTAGIGFGMTEDYGAAQILYIKRGYVPDGNGMVKNGQAVRHGDPIVVDDDLAIYLTKQL